MAHLLAQHLGSGRGSLCRVQKPIAVEFAAAPEQCCGGRAGRLYTLVSVAISLSPTMWRAERR